MMKCLVTIVLMGGAIIASPKDVYAQASVPSSASDNTAPASNAVSIHKVTTDNHVKELLSLEKKIRGLQKGKAEMRRAYEVELKKIDDTKRKRRGWSRDSDLKKMKASSEALAKRLSLVDRKESSAQKNIRLVKSRLASSIEKEKKTLLSKVREKQIQTLVSRFGLRPSTKSRKKILLPGTQIDNMADPDELKEQMALLRQAEKKLLFEERILIAKADIFKRSSRLRRQNNRSKQLSFLDDDRVSRSSASSNATTPTSGRGQGEAAESNEGLAEPSLPDSDSGGLSTGTDDGAGGSTSNVDAFSETQFSLGSLDESSVILAEVVDSGTKSMLRTASNSKNPKVKERAARHAQKSVAKKRQELARLRMQIAKRLRTIGQ